MEIRRATGARHRRPAREAPLEERFRAHLAELGLAGEHARVLVAVSGGCDSVALLHLLHSHARALGVSVCAAHFDHAMRPGSEADARWVAGLCTAWEIPLAVARSAEPLRSEQAARRARYAFLRRAAGEAGATHLATAHHADDQAETVLFRVLRGTGPTGVGGIAPAAAGIVRPLLPFWRREIEGYARRAGLRWREDPTNLSEDPARNRIRLRLLPLIERAIAPRARRNLVRLAELAREDEEAWSVLLAPIEREIARWEGDALLLARNSLRSYDLAVASRLLRNSLRQFGVVLDRTGTRMALQFITGAPSGREMRLPGGLRLATEFDVARIERMGVGGAAPDLTLAVGPGDARGEDRVRIGGRHFRVSWHTAPCGDEEADGDTAGFPLGALRLPLRVRGWLPGDRIRTSGGTKTLKKLFGERRVPRSARARTPVVVDAEGEVLWIPRLVRPREPRPRAGQTALFLSIVDD